MKKFIFVLMTVFFVFAITGCPPEDGEKEGREFWARNIKTDTFYKLNAEKLAETPLCVVWAEKGSGVTDETAFNMANAYVTVFMKMMSTFGWTALDDDLGEVNTMEVAHWLATDTTNDAKLTILLLDIKDNYSASNKAYVAGYFDSINFFDDVHSNNLDMIYMDTYPSKPGSPESNGTLAHEMQHLMNFVSSVAFDRGNVMDTWIDEGLSGAAEWVYSGVHPKIRWEYYNQDQSGLIKKGNNFFIWGNRGDESNYANLDDYATVYLFFQWLRLQSNNSIYKKIIMSEFFDYRAVTNEAKEIDSGYSNWSFLLRDWLAANYINDGTGRYGYKNEKDLRTVKAPMFPGGTTTVNLYPGEGVYSKISGSDTVPSSSGVINYAGLNSSGAPVTSGGSASGARLTYNVNTNKTGSSVPGNTTGVASIAISAGNALLQTASNEFFSDPYIVDAGFYLRRNENIGRYAGKSDKILKIDKSKINKVEIDE
jgi:hypothetical protein